MTESAHAYFQQIRGPSFWLGRYALSDIASRCCSDAVVRGHRSGLLTTADYNNLCQCETLDDIKLNLVSPICLAVRALLLLRSRPQPSVAFHALSHVSCGGYAGAWLHQHSFTESAAVRVQPQQCCTIDRSSARRQARTTGHTWPMSPRPSTQRLWWTDAQRSLWTTGTSSE